jgi:chromosome segregation ATPase
VLDGPTLQEVERIVEDRVRPIETSHGFTRANFVSLKRDLADLHGDICGLRNDEEGRHQQMVDSLHDARTQIRAVAVELAAHRAETAMRLDALDRRAQVTDGRLEGIDGRLEGIDGRLEGIDGRLDGVDGRLEGIDGRLDGVDGRLAGIEAILVEVRELVRSGGSSR